MSYYYCVVPLCTSTSISTPEKYFFWVPLEAKRRKAWNLAMRRKDFLSDKTRCTICEDHFDLQNDLDNYMEWKLSTVRARFKTDVVPHKFACQRKPIPMERASTLKRENRHLVETLFEDMPGCAAVGCSNRSENGYSLKSFPRDPQRRALWTAMVNRKNWTPKNSSYICEKHFDNNQWEVARVDGKKKLKANAIPTIFEISRKKKPALKKKQKKIYNGLKNLVKDVEDVDGVLKMSSQMQSGRLDCLICRRPVASGDEISASSFTATTGITMKQRLIQISNSESRKLRNNNRMGSLCHRCAQLVNYVDKMESELALLKSALAGCLLVKRSNRGREQLGEDFITHLLVLDEFQHKLSGSSFGETSKDPFEKEHLLLEETERTQNNSEISPGLEMLNEKVSVLPDDDGTALESEVRGNVDKEDYQCKICLMKTSSRSVLFFHLRRHMANYQWCDFCDVPMISPENSPSKSPNSESDLSSSEVKLYLV